MPSPSSALSLPSAGALAARPLHAHVCLEPEVVDVEDEDKGREEERGEERAHRLGLVPERRCAEESGGGAERSGPEKRAARGAVRILRAALPLCAKGADKSRAAARWEKQRATPPLDGTRREPRRRSTERGAASSAPAPAVSYRRRGWRTVRTDPPARVKKRHSFHDSLHCLDSAARPHPPR